MDSVREEGDAAVSQWTAKFDKVEVEAVCSPIEVCICISALLNLHIVCGVNPLDVISVQL